MVRVTSRKRTPNKLDNRTARMKLAARRKPYVFLVAPGSSSPIAATTALVSGR